jgi:pyrroline-5-carboxylate reductase
MKLGFIGGGRMAEAFIRSVLKARLTGPQSVFVNDLSVERREYLKRELGVNVYSHSGDVVAAVDVLFLAVKPQDFDGLLAKLAELIREDQLVISIAAGRTIASIELQLPHARVVRVMPNLPCQVGAGMSVYCLGGRAVAADGRTVRTLLEASGKALELPETKFDAVTALSGSGPAFFALFLDRMIDAAIGEGLSREHAVLLTGQTMLGTALVLVEQGTDPKEFVQAVASKGGTTEAGLSALDCDTTTELVRKTIRLAAARSAELSE